MCHKRDNLHYRQKCEVSVIGNNPDVVVNLSTYTLSEPEIMLLSRGLNFSVPPHRLDKFDVMTSFECLFRQLSPGSQTCSSLQRLKHRFRGLCYSYIYGYDHKKFSNLSKDEIDAYKSLAQNKSICICKPDKGNGIVVIDKCDYVNKLSNFLSDQSKFVELTDNPTLERERKLQVHLYYLKCRGALDLPTYNKLRPSGSKPGRIYGLSKVHKTDIPMRPIVSSIGTYSYELSKYLVDLLKPLTTNDYTIKDSFSFVNELNSVTNVPFMSSFDVTSLFTNIPLEETIQICLNKLYSDNDKVNNLTRKQLSKLLNIACRENHFMFNGKMYDQIDGVAMGSPLGPVLANIFMSHFEQQALSNYTDTKPLMYRRYVDDTFLIFENESNMDSFFSYISNLHPNIKFTRETEQNNNISFLDISITRQFDNTLATSVYHKPTFTGLYLRWDSFVPKA